MEMEDQKLCKSCQDWLKDKYGNNFYYAPFSHCHHQCCWCEKEHQKPMKLRFFYDNREVDQWSIAKFCPDCGKKLEEAT